MVTGRAECGTKGSGSARAGGESKRSRTVSRTVRVDRWGTLGNGVVIAGSVSRVVYVRGHDFIVRVDDFSAMML